MDSTKPLTSEQRRRINRGVLESLPRTLLKVLMLSSGPIVALAFLPAIRNAYVFLAWLVVSSVLVFFLSASFSLASYPDIPRDEVWTPVRAVFALSLNVLVVGTTYLVLMR